MLKEKHQAMKSELLVNRYNFMENVLATFVHLSSLHTIVLIELLTNRMIYDPLSFAPTYPRFLILEENFFKGAFRSSFSLLTNMLS